MSTQASRPWCVFMFNDEGEREILGRFRSRISAEVGHNFWSNEKPYAYVDMCHIDDL